MFTQLAELGRARTLLGAPGHTTRSKKLLGAPGIATRSKDATKKCSPNLLSSPHPSALSFFASAWIADSLPPPSCALCKEWLYPGAGCGIIGNKGESQAFSSYPVSVRGTLRSTLNVVGQISKSPAKAIQSVVEMFTVCNKNNHPGWSRLHIYQIKGLV